MNFKERFRFIKIKEKKVKKINKDITDAKLAKFVK